MLYNNFFREENITHNLPNGEGEAQCHFFELLAQIYIFILFWQINFHLYWRKMSILKNHEGTIHLPLLWGLALAFYLLYGSI